MALTIQEDKGATKDLVIADRKLWLNAEGKVVEDGSPEARVLFCAAGQRIARAAAEAVGMTFETKKEAPAKKRTASTKKGK